jgi:hypothetical protein
MRAVLVTMSGYWAPMHLKDIPSLQVARRPPRLRLYLERTARWFASSFLCNPPAVMPKETRCRNNLTYGEAYGAIFTTKRRMTQIRHSKPPA